MLFPYCVCFLKYPPAEGGGAAFYKREADGVATDAGPDDLHSFVQVAG